MLEVPILRVEFEGVKQSMLLALSNHHQVIRDEFEKQMNVLAKGNFLPDLVARELRAAIETAVKASAQRLTYNEDFLKAIGDALVRVVVK